MTGARVVEAHLPAVAASVAGARNELEPLRGIVHDGTLENLRLLVSEIVTNSVRHAGLGAGDDVELRVVATPERVRAEVLDAGPGFEAPLGQPGPGATSGWGLLLVRRLADRWGVDRDDSRTRVWFELDR